MANASKKKEKSENIENEINYDKKEDEKDE